jgi:hypothetical protein
VNALQFSASGKNKAAAALRLRIIGTGGTVLGDTTGPSVVRLTRALSADAYTWEVSGKVSASFTLQITYVAP